MTTNTYDLGVKGERLLFWAKDNSLLKKNAKLYLARKKVGIKEIILDRNNTTWANNLLALARSVYEVAKFRFTELTRFSRVSEGTKIIGAVSAPFAAYGLYQNLSLLLSKGFSNFEKGFDRLFDLVSEASSLTEAVGYVGEAAVAIAPKLAKITPITQKLGIFATITGLVSLVIDVKGAIKTLDAIQDVDTQRPGEEAIKEDIKVAFKERLFYKVGSHVINIVGVLIGFASFALLIACPATLGLLAAALIAASIVITIGRMVLDAYAEQLLVERLNKATL